MKKCQEYAKRFQPAPPVWAETRDNQIIVDILLISTHSARGGGDNIAEGITHNEVISTHSARGGGDAVIRWRSYMDLIFQPTPPVGAETQEQKPICHTPSQISTHSARRGGDAASMYITPNYAISIHSAARTETL